MRAPPAYQVATPFGVNIGGANPAFFAVMAECEYDSWLTVGLTEGNDAGDVSSIGVGWDAWDEQCAHFDQSCVGRSASLTVSLFAEPGSWCRTAPSFG